MRGSQVNIVTSILMNVILSLALMEAVKTWQISFLAAVFLASLENYVMWKSTSALQIPVLMGVTVLIELLISVVSVYQGGMARTVHLKQMSAGLGRVPMGLHVRMH
jgi:hypothetical protein